MPDPVAPASREEQALLQCLASFSNSTGERQAVHIRLSRLKDYHRRDYHRAVVAHCLETACGGFQEARFQLFNGDIVLLLEQGGLQKVDAVLETISTLFADDPLLAGAETPAAELLCRRFELMRDFAELVELAKALAVASKEHDSVCGASNLRARGADQQPLDAGELSAIERAVKQADLSSMMVRQPICAIADLKPPKVAFRELFVSIADLAHAVLPDRNILSNRWLFQDLTRVLDARVLAHLVRENITAEREPVSLNLNIETILTPSFLTFDRSLDTNGRGKMIVELQLFDVIADMNRFFFARDFLRARGYRLCLDGLDHFSVRTIDRRRLGFDLIKLNWSPQLSDILASPRDQALREAIEASKADHTVLCRCESEQALHDGKALGIGFFQGYYVDRLLSGRARPSAPPTQPGRATGRVDAARPQPGR